ncbi:MAG: hypothetical protein ACRDIB_15480, partial [Ardenticatenaceae bacterium]
MTYDVERLVLGGGVTRNGELFLRPVRQTWERLRAASPLAHELLRCEKLQLASTTEQWVAFGAIALAARRFGHDLRSAIEERAPLKILPPAS